METKTVNTVELEFLSKFYNCDPRTIQNWASQFNSNYGIEVRYEKGLYDFVKFVHCKNRHYEDEIKRLEIGDATKYELEKDYLKERIKEKRIIVGELENQKIDIELVIISWLSEVYLFGKSIRGLPGLLATMIPDVSTYEIRYQISNKHVSEILQEISSTEIIETEQKLENQLNSFEQEDKKAGHSELGSESL